MTTRLPEFDGYKRVKEFNQVVELIQGQSTPIVVGKRK